MPDTTTPAALIQAAELPVPEIEPRGLTLEQVVRFMPDRIPLVAGEISNDPDSEQCRRQLLALLLVNTGLREAVKLAPREQWLDALDGVASQLN